MQWLALALGGALGAVSRFWLSHHVYQWLGKQFAWGTLAVNVLGSFLMGFMAVWLVNKLAVSSEWRLFVMTGFLGALTTFSTFSFETLQYLQTGELGKALANVLISVLLCLLAVWLGFHAGKWTLTE
ncbi:MAG TPA: fluoride efflux transporter CrcB [Piscirickettsiaceae bacterium]|nr:fluoride efflux transporter CrcB [Piscirickettsiaceae bacterium]